MEAFIAGVSGAVGGAIGGLAGFLLAKLMDWRSRPRIRIELDSDDGKASIFETQIRDSGWIKDQGIDSKGYGQALMFRVNVSNIGRTPASKCEGRFRVYLDRNGKTVREPVGGRLHWAILDPEIERENQFAPIDLNPGYISEWLDVFLLPYQTTISYEDGQPKEDTYFADELRVYSARPYLMESGQEYELEISISSTNAVTRPMRLKVNWDGTPDQFRDGAFVQLIP